MWFSCLQLAVVRHCWCMLVHVGSFRLFKIAKAAKELLHFRSSHFTSTQWRCVDFASFRNVYELQILPPKFWTICLWLSQLTILMSPVLLSNMRIHAADWWLFVQRYSASARHCLKDSGLPRILDKDAIHVAKAMLLGQNSTSIARNICEMTFMKSHVAIICQQFMNESTHKSTSRAARGGGGSFKNGKRIGEIGCCESRMTKRKHWWIWLTAEMSNWLND